MDANSIIKFCLYKISLFNYFIHQKWEECKNTDNLMELVKFEK